VLDLSGVPVWLRGDPTRLRQALLNYATNAIKFTSQGQIVLRAEVLEESGDEFCIRFEVEDSGIGISPENLKGLFQSFEQVDVSTTRKYGGTGLGLAITSRLARLMGGEVGVQSELQHGSTFWLTARFRRGIGVMPNVTLDKTTNQEDVLRRHYARSRVLVADDVEVNLEVAQLLLHGVGLLVDSARNGLEAVDMVRVTAYDLILMDVQMPVMSGLAATRAIRQMSGRAHTPVLAMTANAFEEDRRNCIDSGMNDFVSKPVDPETLYSLLIKWLPRTDGTRSDELVQELAESSLADPVAARETAQKSSEPLSLRQRLESVPGLDIESGMARVRGSEEKFERVIELFWRGHESDLEKLDAALDAGNLGLVEQLAHALKGSAGLIGAARVADQATALLNTIRAKAAREIIDKAYAALRPSMRSLLDGLKHVRSDEVEELVVLDPDRCRLVLTRLERLLEEGDMEAVSFAREESALLNQALGENARAILLTIQSFDYTQALAELRASKGRRALID
jgi:CheY-like chemotaxis protein